jgi:hypothetical protein
VWHDLHPTLCFSAGRFFLVRTKLAISDETNGREEITCEPEGLIKNLDCGLIQEIMMGFFTKRPDGRAKPWNPCVLYY